MFVIIIVAAGALLLFREPVEAPSITVVDEVPAEETRNNSNVPKGFTPPTTPPPSLNPAQDGATIDTEAETDVSATSEIAQEQL